MFDELFNNLKHLVDAKVQEAVKELERRFAVPEAAEPFTLIRQFAVDDATVTKGGITVVGEGWQIEAYDDKSSLLAVNEPLRTVILFELLEPDDSECVLACRFQARAINTENDIEIKLGLCKQLQLGTTTRAWTNSIAQTEDFQFFEIRGHFQKDTKPAKVQIIIEFESSGILEIKDVELLKASVKPLG